MNWHHYLRKETRWKNIFLCVLCLTVLSRPAPLEASNTAGKKPSNGATSSPVRDKVTNCLRFSTLEQLYELPSNSSSSFGDRCLIAEYNPGHNITMLKVSSSVEYLQKHWFGVQSFVDYIKNETGNAFSLTIYVASDSDWRDTGAMHFSKIRGIEASMKLGYNWTIFTDLDFIIRGQSQFKTARPSLSGVIGEAQPNTSLIIQHEHAICSCLHFWRNSEWSKTFLQQWWDTGATSQCCTKHSYDQIVFHALLAGNNLPLAHTRWRQYCAAIRHTENPNVLLTRTKLHGAPWNGDGSGYLFWHSGHQNWNGSSTVQKSY